jgi:TPR repeat protein
MCSILVSGQRRASNAPLFATLFLVSTALLGCVSKPPVLDMRSSLATSAQAGDRDAQFNLGKSYCCGYGPGRDTAKALEFFCMAARQGHAGAQYEIGRYYGLRTDTGYSTSQPQDRIYAHMWYSLAALQDWPLAAAERDALAKDMSEQEIREAQSHVRGWELMGCR